MIRHMLKIGITATVCTLSSLYGDQLGLNINSDTVEAEFVKNLDAQIGYTEGSHYNAFVRYLHRDDSLVQVGFLLNGTLENADSFQFGGGIEGVFGSSYGAVPIFVEASYVLPLSDPLPTTQLLARLAYAPSVLTFSDADTYRAYRFEIDTQIVPRFHLYAGYRNIDTDYETHNQTFDDSWYGGIRFHF